MTPITRQDILAHQAAVPWAAQYQVEQDLLLCRSMVALFDDKFLSSQVAMRGGTLEHIYEGLTAGGATAALAASIFHYREYTVRECKDYLAARGVPVRL